MPLIGFRSSNHPRQVAKRDPLEEIDDRATDPAFFAPLNTRFKFTVDVAAAAHNAKLDRYFDRQVSGLLQSWANETVWCNPPYSGIRPWIEKAWDEYGAANGIVMLLPANRTEQGWWQELVEPFRDRAGSPLTVEFLPGRIRFIKAGRNSIGPNERPPFGCCLLIWNVRVPLVKGGAL